MFAPHLRAVNTSRKRRTLYSGTSPVAARNWWSCPGAPGTRVGLMPTGVFGARATAAVTPTPPLGSQRCHLNSAGSARADLPHSSHDGAMRACRMGSIFLRLAV